MRGQRRGAFEGLQRGGALEHGAAELQGETPSAAPVLGGGEGGKGDGGGHLGSSFWREAVGFWMSFWVHCFV